MAENYGGAMTLKHAKKLHMQMHGGVIPMPPLVQKAIEEAKKIVRFWNGISKWLNDLNQELSDEVINNPEAPKSYVRVAENFVNVLNSIKGFQTILDTVAAIIGSGRHGGTMRGGMSFEDVGKYAQKIAEIYGWLSANKPAIFGILGLRAMQPVGNKVLDIIKPIFGAIGLGRHGGAKHCMCDGMHGGALPILDVNTMTYESKPNAHRKIGGRRKSCSSDEMMGGVGLLEKLHLGGRKHGGRKHGGAMLAPGPRLRPPTAAEQQAAYDRDHKEMVMSGEYDRIMAEKMANRPARVVGLGRKHGGRGMEPRSLMTFPESMGSGKSKLKLGGKKPSARGEIVKKVMREQGLSLPQASKYVKEHGLY